jgi:hypothetical protein
MCSPEYIYGYLLLEKLRQEEAAIAGQAGQQACEEPGRPGFGPNVSPENQPIGTRGLIPAMARWASRMLRPTASAPFSAPSSR